jgi:hypothetical protein
LDYGLAAVRVWSLGEGKKEKGNEGRRRRKKRSVEIYRREDGRRQKREEKKKNKTKQNYCSINHK